MLSPAQSKLTPASDVYTFSRGSEEQERLVKQHAYITEAIYKGRLIYDNDIKLEKGSKVLDSATGTGSWVLDLSKEVDMEVTIIGADISTAMFPSSYPRNVRFVETSVTNMPKEWEASFDFIHQRLLIAALTESQWKEALKESLRVLKPGGAIQLVDKRSFYPSGKGLQNTWEARKMVRAVLQKRGQLPDCGNRLSQFAKAAGYEKVQENIVHAPIGKSWGHIGEAGSENFKGALREFAKAAIAEGGLGLYSSVEEIHTVLEAAGKEWDNIEGLFFEFVVVTGRKPL